MFITLLCLCLNACGSKQEPKPKTLPLVPLDGLIIDPHDDVLKARLVQFLSENKAPTHSTYDYYRIDLDNDKRRDALVLFKSPFGYWCRDHGCALAVFKAQNANFELVNIIEPIRAPLYVHNNTHNGWKEIISRVSGRWTKSRTISLKYDGQQYPNNPEEIHDLYLKSIHGTDIHLAFN